MMHSVRAQNGLVAVAALLLTLSACSGDGATIPDAALTPELAAEALEALSVVSVVGFGGGPAVRATADMPAATEGVDESFPCPAGGTTRARGSATANETTGAVSADVRQDYNGCAVTVASNRTWTFDGDPDIRLRFNASFNESTGAVSLSGSQVGAVRFNSGGESGRCSINLTMSATATAYTISGRVCGQAVSESVSLEP